MAEDDDRPETAELEEPVDEWAAGLAWHNAWLRYLDTGSEEDERKMLVACIPLLRAVAYDPQRTRRAPYTGRALGELSVVLQDRLAGWGWLSLAKKTKGQGRNSRHFLAMGYVFAYIEAVRNGIVLDSDPLGSIQNEYGIKDINSIYRWRGKYNLPPAEHYRWAFNGRTEDLTERAQRFLKEYGEAYQRKPSDTSPVGGPRTGILPRENGQ